MKWNFTNSKYVDGLMYVPVTFPYNRPDAILFEDFKIEQLVECINRKGLKKAYIQGMEDFAFLKDCGGLEHLKIEFHLPFHKWDSNTMKKGKIRKDYDLDILYRLPNLKSLQLIDSEEASVVIPKTSVWIDRIPTLEYFRGEAGFIAGLKSAKNLKVLGLTGYKQKNLAEIGQLEKLETLSLFRGKVETLDGCETLENLQCLYLSCNRGLQDISALSNLKQSLKLLRIDHCAKIEDFSVLEDLGNLELLHLDGSQTLPNLEFLNRMPNLKTFICHMNVANGDLTPCLRLLYAYMGKNRKHYNLKDDDLPKIEYVRGNENIEEWKRIE